VKFFMSCYIRNQLFDNYIKIKEIKEKKNENYC